MVNPKNVSAMSTRARSAAQRARAAAAIERPPDGPVAQAARRAAQAAAEAAAATDAVNARVRAGELPGGGPWVHIAEETATAADAAEEATRIICEAKGNPPPYAEATKAAEAAASYAHYLAGTGSEGWAKKAEAYEERASETSRAAFGEAIFLL